MFSKSSLYVSVVKHYNQLKLEYKQLSNDNIIKVEQASFLINENSMSQDAIYKLKALEQNEPQIYISTLCDTLEQKLILKSNQKAGDLKEAVNLNSEYNVFIDKSALFETKHFFETSGIDYIYSPFHILNLHCEQNPSSNELVGLILNNSLYVVILDDKNQILYSKIKSLTPFEDIKASNFYNDEISGQKLFDQIYYFEIENAINTVLKEFYEIKESNTFIDKITILHTIRQLSEEQVNRLHEELLIEVNYHSISLDDYIYELAKEPLKKQKSFIKARKKQKSRFLFFTLTIISLLVTFSAFYFYQYILDKKEVTQQEMLAEGKKLKQKQEEAKKELLKPKLPNHIQINSEVEKRFLSIFEAMPYSILLDELMLDKKSSVLKVNLLANDIYIKDIQPKLLKNYKSTQINFEEKETKIEALKAIISNSELISANEVKKLNLPKYKIGAFLPKRQVEARLRLLLGENAVFLFQSDTKSSISTFNYQVTLIHKEPKEFFDIIEKLNKELYSINIFYPIKMKKLPQGLETTFIIQFHQNN